MHIRFRTLITLTLLGIMAAGCSSLDISSSDRTSEDSVNDGLSLDINVSFGPDNPEPSTSIDISIPTPGWVRLEVLNVTGYRVKLLVDRQMDAGAFAVEWDGNNDDGQPIKSGIYMYRLEAAGQVAISIEPLCRTPEECEELISES